MALSRQEITKELVADILLSQLDEGHRVIKVSVDHPEVSGEGFLTKRGDDIELYTQNGPGSDYELFNGASFKGHMDNNGNLSFDEALQIKNLIRQPDIHQRMRETELSSYQREVSNSYQQLQEFLYMPPMIDNGGVTNSPEIHRHAHTQDNNYWYRDLSKKLDTVARKLKLQSTDLPFMKESMASELCHFDSFDVEKEAQNQYHSQQRGLLGVLEKAIERNSVLIQNGMLVSLDFDDASKRLSFTVKNKAMETVSQGVSMPMIENETEVTADEEIQMMYGQGARFVNKEVSIGEAIWNFTKGEDIGEILTEGMCQLNPDQFTIMTDTELRDGDGDYVDVSANHDIYEDIAELAVKQAKINGRDVLPIRALDQDTVSQDLTKKIGRLLPETIHDIAAVMPTGKNNDNRIEYDSEMTMR